MNTKKAIRKILFVTIWLCIGAGMLTLLLAAISKKNKGACRDYVITIKGSYNNFFIDKNDIEKIIFTATKGTIKGEQIATFRLHELEQLLEQNNWINTAELYFDNQDVLHITITEKEPIARIFTVAGNSFYIDKGGRKMPLSDKLSARVPVFTGFPDRKNLLPVDSALLNEVKVAADYIINDTFWMSQVSQIDITSERNFEMIPVVGNHLVKLGNGGDIEKKFHRLMVFYKQVLSKTGFDKYKVIDVQYKGQVVASRFINDAKIDSIQLRKNVEKLLRQSMEAESDTVIRMIPSSLKLEPDSASLPDPALNDITELNSEQPNPNPLKPVLPKPSNQKMEKPKPEMKEKTTGTTNVRMPKAVMPKKQPGNNNDSNN